MNKFLAAPREYVSQEPVLTNELLNIALIGPRESGKKTLAMQIKKHYDYRVVDLEQVIQEQILL
jgi:predicted AAA+ superfamily ATPase